MRKMSLKQSLIDISLVIFLLFVGRIFSALYDNNEDTRSTAMLVMAFVADAGVCGDVTVTSR